MFLLNLLLGNPFMIFFHEHALHCFSVALEVPYTHQDAIILSRSQKSFDLEIATCKRDSILGHPWYSVCILVKQCSKFSKLNISHSDSSPLNLQGKFILIFPGHIKCNSPYFLGGSNIEVSISLEPFYLWQTHKIVIVFCFLLGCAPCEGGYLCRKSMHAFIAHCMSPADSDTLPFLLRIIWIFLFSIHLVPPSLNC